MLSLSASPICQMLNSWTDLIQDFPNMRCCDKTTQQKQLRRGFPLAQSSSYLQRSGGDEYLCIHLVFYILGSPENGATHFYGRSSNLSSYDQDSPSEAWPKHWPNQVSSSRCSKVLSPKWFLNLSTRKLSPAFSKPRNTQRIAFVRHCESSGYRDPQLSNESNIYSLSPAQWPSTQLKGLQRLTAWLNPRSGKLKNKGLVLHVVLYPYGLFLPDTGKVGHTMLITLIPSAATFWDSCNSLN